MLKTESEVSPESPSVLIIAYRRASNLAQILDLCEKANIRNIYISIDVPKEGFEEAWIDHKAVLDAIENFEAKSEVQVSKRIAKSNQGCAVTVLLGCDWALKTANELIVIEDDCIPTPAFFRFCITQLPLLSLHEDLWIVCGTQFAPAGLTEGKAFHSQYALTWGWAVTSEKWSAIRPLFFKPSRFLKTKDFFALTPEQAFWNAGARRAHQGFTDVWDTIFVKNMKLLNKFAILPPVNLVLNLGNDKVSTHVESDSPWTRLEAHNPDLISSASLSLTGFLDSWIRHNFYKIRFRHLFSTKFTLIRDILFAKKRRKFKSSLYERLARGITT